MGSGYFILSFLLQDGVISCLVGEVLSPMMDDDSLYSHGSQVEDATTPERSASVSAGHQESLQATHGEVSSPILNQIGQLHNKEKNPFMTGQASLDTCGLKHALSSDSFSGDSSVLIIKVTDSQDRKKPVIHKLEDHNASRPSKYMGRFTSQSGFRLGFDVP